MQRNTVLPGVGIVILFFMAGLGYCFYTPLWNPPDEERHFAYCEYIAQHHKLPEFRGDSGKDSVDMGFHPPLYHLIGSLFCTNDGKLLEEEITINDGPGFQTLSYPNEGKGFALSGKAKSAYLLRLFSLVLGGINVCLIYLIMLTIFPGEIILASAAMLFVAMNPQFLHISASVSNETLNSTVSTGYLFSLIYYLKDPSKLVRQILSGVLLGCCILSKSSSIFFIPLTVCIITLITLRVRRNPIAPLFIILCTAIFVGGWWYLRNWLVFNDPLFEKTAAIAHPWFMRYKPISFSDIVTIADKTFISFFGYFGAFKIPIPGLHLSIYGGILLLGIIGFYQLLVKRELTAFQSIALAVLFLALLAGVGFFVLINIRYIGMFLGRYLFIVMAPIAVITYAGLRFLLPPQRRTLLLLLISLVLIILNLDVLFRVLKPAYAKPSLLATVDQPLFNYPTAVINAGTSVGQTFVSTANNLCAIRVLFSITTERNRGEITFLLKEGGGNGKVLARMNLPIKEIQDCVRYFFIFPPIKNSKDKEYVLCFISPQLSPGEGTALWYETEDCYPQGNMLVNDKPASGDLYFTAYYFTGEKPRTDWEGKKEMVIRQGLYIDIWEYQLYIERSEDFRITTPTHKKLLQMETAFKNRFSQMKQ